VNHRRIRCFVAKDSQSSQPQSMKFFQIILGSLVESKYGCSRSSAWLGCPLLWQPSIWLSLVRATATHYVYRHISPVLQARNWAKSSAGLLMSCCKAVGAWACPHDCRYLYFPHMRSLELMFRFCNVLFVARRIESQNIVLLNGLEFEQYLCGFVAGTADSRELASVSVLPRWNGICRQRRNQRASMAMH
jgi:hypothetical protein